MSSEWRSVQLSDLIEIRHGWPFKREFFVPDVGNSGSPIVVAVGNFDYSGGFRFGSTQVKTYSDEFPPEYRLVACDILLVMTCQTAGGEILGIPGRIPSDGRTYLHNQRLGKVVPKSAEVSKRFLYWLFLSKDFNQHLVNSATGTKILHTAPKRIESFRLRLPPLQEQEAIAALLDCIDDRIALLRETNATLEAIAQALFKSWFVDFDPVHAKMEGRAPEGVDEATAALFPDGFEESALGPVPIGWKIKALDEIATYLNGLALQKFPPSDDAWLPVIKIAQLRKGDTIGADRASRNIKPDYIVQNGDALFSWSGSLEVEVWCGGEGALNQHLFKVTSDTYSKWFYLLWTRHYLEHFRQVAASKATTMGHIQRKHLSEAKSLAPPVELLSAMSAHLEPLLARSLELKLQAQTLATLRDTLLPRLISGQLRLPPPPANPVEAASVEPHTTRVAARRF